MGVLLPTAITAPATAPKRVSGRCANAMPEMTDQLALLVCGVLILLLGSSGLPERVTRSRAAAGLRRSLERILRANRLRFGYGWLLAGSAVAGLAAGRLTFAYSVPLALVVGIAAALAPATLLWLRTAAHERRIERETIAVTRQLAAHLGAGENLYSSIRQIAGEGAGPAQSALGQAADEFRFDRTLAAALLAAAGAAGHPCLALLLSVLAQLARQGAQGQAAADVLDLVAQQMEHALRAREQLVERTRGVAVQTYVVAGAIPLMAVWLWQTSPYRFSVFELPLGRSVLLPFAVTMELLGLALLWRWSRPGSI